MHSLRRILSEACGEDRIKDTIKGGLADKMDPSEFDQKELMKGIHTEIEHVNDILQAMEIAMDHLSEDPDYYEKLASIHQESPVTGGGDEWLDNLDSDDLDPGNPGSGRQNANLKRTWQRVWKGKQ